MDSLEKQLLLRDAELYGYHLVQPETEKPESVVRKMIASDDTRILEGVPVVLTNILIKNNDFDLQQVEEELPPALQRRFRMLAAVTCLFMFWLPESETARTLLQTYLKRREPALLQAVKDKLSSEKAFAIGNNIQLTPGRLERTYRNYVVDEFKQSAVSVAKTVDDTRMAQFHKSIDQLFTQRQKALIIKMLNNSEMSKTEREYFSRVVKPRLKALKNSDLQTIATALVG